MQPQEQLPFERVAATTHPSAFETLVDSAFKSSTGLAHVHMDSTLSLAVTQSAVTFLCPAGGPTWGPQTSDRYYRGRFFVVHIFAQQAVA